MLFARFIPDWNSLDAVRCVHSDLEFAAIVFFGVLVVFDVLAHLTENKKRERLFEKIGLYFFAVAVISEAVAYKYGQRNDELSAQIIGSLDSQAKDAGQRVTAVEKKASELDTRLDTTGKNVDAVSQKADGIDTGLKKTQEDVNHLDAFMRGEFHNLEDRRRVLCPTSGGVSAFMGERVKRFEEVKKYERTPVLIQVVTSDLYESWRTKDDTRLADDISCVLRAARWENPQFTGDRALPFAVQYGVEVFVRGNPPVESNTIPNPPSTASLAASALVNLLDLDLGPEAGRGVGVEKRIVQYDKGGEKSFFDPNVPAGYVFILVGPNPENGSIPSAFAPQPSSQKNNEQNKKPKSTPNAKR